MDETRELDVKDQKLIDLSHQVGYFSARNDALSDELMDRDSKIERLKADLSIANHNKEIYMSSTKDLTDEVQRLKEKIAQLTRPKRKYTKRVKG